MRQGLTDSQQACQRYFSRTNETYWQSKTTKVQTRAQQTKLKLELGTWTSSSSGCVVRRLSVTDSIRKMSISMGDCTAPGENLNHPENETWKIQIHACTWHTTHDTTTCTIQRNENLYWHERLPRPKAREVVMSMNERLPRPEAREVVTSNERKRHEKELPRHCYHWRREPYFAKTKSSTTNSNHCHCCKWRSDTKLLVNKRNALTNRQCEWTKKQANDKQKKVTHNVIRTRKKGKKESDEKNDET